VRFGIIIINPWCLELGPLYLPTPTPTPTPPTHTRTHTHRLYTEEEERGEERQEGAVRRM
jgi:hypothetical protein